MALLIMLLLAAPALAQPADCPAIPVGPPMNVEIYAGLAGRTKAPVVGPVVGALGLTGLPAFGTLCVGPPPPAGDVLRGTPAPHDLLRGDATGDVLRGKPAAEVVVGTPRPVPSRPDVPRP